MKYTVGQVLYVIPSKQAAVHPMQVVEELTKRSLSGETEVIYMVHGGPNTKGPVRLDEVSGEVFESSDEVRKTLIERVTQQLSRVVDVAVNKAEEWFYQPHKTSHKVSHKIPDSFDAPDPKDAVVDLGNGMIAKIKLPDQVAP